MKKIILLACIALSCLLTSCGDAGTTALISTNYGDIKVLLYDATPQHRDNFVKLAKEGFYDGTLFHRIIPNFMIQGGDPDSKTAQPGQALGMGGPGYRVPAEIGIPHFRGALAAARDGNPEKASSGSQFYIVTGKEITEAELNSIAKGKKLNYNEEQKKIYLEVGGTPFLDGDYTVFGEVLEGMDVVDKISALKTAPSARPEEDVKMTVKLL